MPPLPVPTPTAVVDGGEVDEVVRAARAGIAMLSLQLRTAEGELRVAEEELAATSGDPDAGEDLSAARALLRTSLDHHVSVRRAAQAAELDEAGREAVRTIRLAQAEAAAMVASAHDEAGILLASLAGDDLALMPVLRVVTNGSEDHEDRSASPGTEPGPEVEADEEPDEEADEPAAVAEPQAPGPVRREAEPAPAAMAAAAEAPPGEEPTTARPVVPAPSAPPPAPPVAAAAMAVAPAPDLAGTGGLPTEDDELWDRLGMSEARFDDGWMEGRQRAVVALAGAAPAVAAPTPPRRRPAWARFLYADVVLPMVAVLIVFVVLLAWVG